MNEKYMNDMERINLDAFSAQVAHSQEEQQQLKTKYLE